MAKDFTEGHLAGHLQAEGNHASNPEEQNIPPGLKDRGRIQRIQIMGVIGPTECAERPKTGRKPSCGGLYYISTDHEELPRLFHPLVSKKKKN